MYLIIPIVGGAMALVSTLAAVVPVVIPVTGVVGGLIVSPAVLKASGNAVALLKDGKIGLEVQNVIKKISDCDEKIGDLVIDKNLEFDNEMFNNEIKKLKENIDKLKDKKIEIEKLKAKE